MNSETMSQLFQSKGKKKDNIGFKIWKPFEMHFGIGEGICHIDVFCIFAIVAMVTMSKFW